MIFVTDVWSRDGGTTIEYYLLWSRQTKAHPAELAPPVFHRLRNFPEVVCNLVFVGECGTILHRKRTDTILYGKSLPSCEQ